MSPESLPFRISTGLKNLIGRDLITDDYVAVFELVKNAFDAYATEVVITFGEDKITISDNGKGMSLDDIREKWLFVAYSAKREGIEDTELGGEEFESYRDRIHIKRYYAGAKGIGRFSCDRLGSRLTLTTKSASANSNLEQIEVNWADFDQDSSQEFVSISVEHRTVTPIRSEHKKLSHGTILEISQLNSVWTREKKLDLKKSLEKLINPIDQDETRSETDASGKEDSEVPTGVSSEFRIVVVDQGERENDRKAKHVREKVNGPVKNFVFETLKLKTTQVLTEIDEMGDYITVSIKDRGTLIYKIRKPNRTEPSLKNIRFHLFFLNRAAKSNFTRLMGIQPVNFGSVFVYKNGFRIAPYGDAGDDSFGLAIRKGQKYNKIGIRDLIGRIEILGDNPSFQEVTSRNGGLVKNDHYRAMADCFIENCLAKLEDYLQKVAWKVGVDKDLDDTSALKGLSSKSAVIDVISDVIAGKEVELQELDTDFINFSPNEINEFADDETISNLKSIARKLNNQDYLRAAEEIESENRALRKRLIEEEDERKRQEDELLRLERELELERSRNTYLTATRRVLSDDAKGLIHAIKINTIKINKSVGNLIRKVKAGTLREKDIVKELTSIKFYSDRAFKISKLITRAGFKSDVEKQTVDIARYVEQYLSIFSELADDTSIQFDVYRGEATLYRKVSVLALSIVLDDLISNSAKWKASRISVEISNLQDGGLRILFSDNGDGLIEKYLGNSEPIFDLGVTETDGSGIGLYNARRSLREMGAEIRFIGNGVVLSGAAFELIFHK